MLETRDLTRRFGGLTAVDAVSLSISVGELRSIIGPNGAGKSTLFNLISGALSPTSGSIYFKGVDITGARPERGFRMGMVRSFQVSHLFSSLTVRENVELMAVGRMRRSGMPFSRCVVPVQQVNEKVESALERVGLAASGSLPASTLSHGDRRLVEIAMALAADPEILLLDEPTAGMSPEETKKTADLLGELSPHITIVIVEHDMSVVMSISDRVTVLHRGAVLVDGTPSEIRGDDRVKEIYFGHGG